MLDINNMKRSDFYYDLPQELIAQTPVEPRNASRMMKINRQTGEVVHDHFYNLCNYLKKVTCLCLTTQRCFLRGYTASVRTQARSLSFCLWSRKRTWSGDSLQTWQKAKIGTRFVFGGGKLKAEIIDVLEDETVSHDLSARRISLPHLTR